MSDKDVNIEIDTDIDTEVNTEINILIQKAHDLLDTIKKLLKKKKKWATHIVVYQDGKPMEEGQMGKPLSNTDVRRLTLVPKDDKEKVDSVEDGSMKAVSTDDAICAVALDPLNQLEAILTPADGAQGTVTFTFTADANMGEGVSEITGEYSCEVVDQMATIIQVEEGVDSPKAPTATPIKK